jgi:glycosyltransferase 2 family protein
MNQWLMRFREASSRARPALTVVGMTIGLGLLLWQLVRSVQLMRASPALVPTPMLLVAMLGCALLSHLTQMMGWRWLMCGLGHKLPWRQVIGGYMLSFLPRYIPGSAWGYLSRGAWFARAGVPQRVSAAGSVLETLVIVSAGAGLGLGFVLNTTGAALLGVMAGVVALAAGQWGLRFLPTWRELPMPDLRYVLLTTGHVLPIWLLYGVLIQLALGMPNGALERIEHAAQLFYVAWFAGAAAVFVPAGLGVRELALTGLLSGAQLSSPDAAAVVPVLIRIVMLCSELIWLLGAVALNRVNSARNGSVSDKLSE